MPAEAINLGSSSHYEWLIVKTTIVGAPPALNSPGTSSGVDKALLRQLVADNYDFIWRLLSRLKVSAEEVDDATQQVFMVLLSKSSLVLKPGSERSYLFGVAIRTAQEFRRKAATQRARAVSEAADLSDERNCAESIAEQRNARRILDEILETFPEQVKIVFILFELEGMSAREIAELTSTPMGTIASRLRRGRELFEERVAEYQSRPTKGDGR